MKKRVLILLTIIIIFPSKVYATQGCCSHHGGVDYCGEEGKYICKDGYPSPSCKCNYTNYNKSAPINEATEEANSNDENNKNILPIIMTSAIGGYLANDIKNKFTKK